MGERAFCSSLEELGMVPQVILHKSGDEEVAVVVALQLQCNLSSWAPDNTPKLATLPHYISTSISVSLQLAIGILRIW